MKDCNKDILRCLNESCEMNEASDQFTGLREVLANVEKQFGVVLDTDIDDNGEGEFFFDTNYDRRTFETETEANEFEDKYQEEAEKWCRDNGYSCHRSEDEDAPLSFWIAKATETTEEADDNMNESTSGDRSEITNKHEEIAELLNREFDATAVIFNNTFKEAESEFYIAEPKAKPLPEKADLAEKVKSIVGFDVEVHYTDHKNRNTLKVLIDPVDTSEYWDVYISHDGQNYTGLIARIYDDLDRAKRVCKYYNKQRNSRYAGKFVLVDRSGAIIYDKDGDR